MKITLHTIYGIAVGTFEIPPFNGYPDAVFLGERIYAHRKRPPEPPGYYREGHFIHLREEDRREGTHR